MPIPKHKAAREVHQFTATRANGIYTARPAPPPCLARGTSPASTVVSGLAVLVALLLAACGLSGGARTPQDPTRELTSRLALATATTEPAPATVTPTAGGTRPPASTNAPAPTTATIVRQLMTPAEDVTATAPVSARTETAAATGTPQPTEQPSPLASRNQIALLRDGSVWLVSVEGGEGRRLAGGDNLAPAWSPAGDSVAFIKLRGETGGGSLLVISADAGITRQVASGPVTQLAWSPDGRKIAYTRTTDTDGDGLLQPDRDASEVRLVDVHGRADRRLSAGFDPSWLPHGDGVLLSTEGRLVAGVRERNELRVVDLAGKTVSTVARTSDVPADLRQYGTPFLAAARLLRHGAVSSDGETVAFSALGGVGVLGTISLGGGTVQVQDIIAESGFGPVVWAPDDGRIAYDVPTPSGLDQVVVLDVATGNRLAFGDIQDETSFKQPSWSPDGASIALVRLGPGGTSDLVIADTRTARVTKLLSGDVSSPSWRRAP